MSTDFVAGDASNQATFTGGNDGAMVFRVGPNGAKVDAISITSGGAVSIPNLSVGVSMRNKIINGAMAIDQRNAGTAQTFTAAAALAYSVDRWYGYCTGANVTGQRVAGTAPNKFNYRFTGAASVTKIGFAQRIEAANCQDLAGTTATLSVDLANSLLTTVTWTAWYASTEDTFGTLASPTRTQIATGTFTVSSTLTRYNTQISIPSAATTGIEIEFSVGAQISGTWTIGRVQLEAGTVATPFEYRLHGFELSLCQRYFCKTFDQNVVPAQNSTTASHLEVIGQVTNQLVSTNWLFPVQMRATPTITTYSPNGASANWSTNTNTPTVQVTGANAQGVTLRATTTIGAGFAYTIHATALAEIT